MSAAPAAADLPGRDALHLRKVGRRFGAVVALDQVDLRIAAGERRAILGPNGAGKTTLFNAITGDFPPTAGRVVLFGEDVTTLPPHQRTRRGLRRTYQNSLLFSGLSVRENLYLAQRGVAPNRLSLRRPRAGDGDMEEAAALARRVGLHGAIDRLVRDLSHGQQRQLEFGMALAGQPRLLLLDEPAAGLSAGERTELRLLLAQVPREITIILIEHDMDVALQAADRVTVMQNGRVVTEGTPDEIQADQRVHDIYLGKYHA